MSPVAKQFSYRISQNMHSRLFKGYLSELIVFKNPLNKAGRRIIENYLSSKYNLPITGDRYKGDNNSFNDYDLEVSGIGKDYDGMTPQSNSAGLIIENIDFLQDDGDYLLYGHHTKFNIITTSDLDKTSGITRWSRDWFVDVTDINDNNGQIRLTFDYSKAGFYTLPPAKAALMSRNTSQDAFEIIPVTSEINNDQITFVVNVQDIADKYITVGLLPSDYMLDFTDSDMFVDLGNEVDIISTSFSVEFWARRSYTPCEAYQSIIGHGSDLQDYSALSIGFHYCKFRFEFFGDALQTNQDHNDTHWHYWAITYDSTTQERIIYKDGIELIKDNAGDNYTGLGAFTLGKCLRGNFNGQIDELRLWNDVRTPEEIRENMHRAMDPEDQGLEVYLPLNEGFGDTTIDLSPNAFPTRLTATTSNDWKVSTAPVSSRYGPKKLALALKYNTSEIPVHVARMDTNPDGDLPPEAIEGRYWAVTCFDEGLFNTDMIFTIPEYLRPGDQIEPERFALYQRNSNGTGQWNRIADAYLVDNLLNSITFQNITTTGQFMVARFNAPPVVLSGYRLNDFDGIDDSLSTANPINLSGSSFTFEFFAKRLSQTGNHDVISHTNFSGDTDISMGFSDAIFKFRIYTNELQVITTPDTDWHHYACKFDQDSQKQIIYIDGQLKASNTLNKNYTETGTITIGRTGNSHLFNGALDEIRIWSKAISQEIIDQNRFKPINPYIHSSLELYYRFDDPEAGNMARDASLNRRHAIITNMNDTRILSDVWQNRTINPTLTRLNAGNALDFNESFEGHYVDFPAIFPNQPDAFTVEWWVFPTALNDNQSMPVSAMNNDLYFHSSVTTQGALTIGTYTGVTLSDGTIEINKWQHIAYVHDGYTGTVYIDGNKNSASNDGWHHIAVVGKDNEQHFYVNGEFKGTSVFR
ncbi:MAG: hypothetical protein OMM_03692 [Candidatus Magnetoglobus multicellularis str. Araruama]|uniref:LamG-like jellyroll fold domain-containing protein n=1 Tax=Candidatus Magnetoglobus multicellularis str. Araruama TaxID=890399 RepID=A0A1V1P4W7_9BACT|nr:MAG: hypothetical protein OMM_03692 [Candidatus Magnetoglobus multicellularis str. Araruama]